MKRVTTIQNAGKSWCGGLNSAGKNGVECPALNGTSIPYLSIKDRGLGRGDGNTVGHSISKI